MSSEQFGKLLLGLGLLVSLTGLIVMFQDRLGFLKHLGRLPGDIAIERGNFKFYFPLATSILASILLTLIFSWLNRR